MNFYKCFERLSNECGLKYVMAETRDKAKSIALRDFCSDGWEMEYTQVGARIVRNPQIIKWLNGYVDEPKPQIIEKDEMFCHKCEGETGLFYLMQENGVHVCEVDEEDE